jgi:hypothetical protein
MEAVGVRGGHVALKVQGMPTLSRRHIYADGHPRRLKAVGVCGGYAEGYHRRIASENLKLQSYIIFVVIYLVLSII